MGSACCVARKNDHLTNSRATGEVLNRNAIYSPSWSFRRDNRRRVAGEIEHVSYELSPGFSGDSSMEIKGELALERGSNSSRNFRITMSPKSPIHEGLEEILEAPSDVTNGSHGSMEEKSFKVNTSPPLSDPRDQARKASRSSPGHQLSRQISDSRILGRKSPTVYEGRPSFVLSSSNSDTAGGCSDGWSVRTFSELVASSRRERWSIDSESSSTCSGSPTVDNIRNCGICSKHLNERSLWSGQKIVANNDLSAVVAAVLGCGHVYHAECLEAMTREGDECDPLCPICIFGSKQLVKMRKKIARAEATRNKMSKRRVWDSYEVLHRRKTVEEDEEGGRLFRSGSSGGGRKPSFLRKHFWLGSKNRFWSRFH